LSKALQWAKKLKEMCLTKTENITKQEAHAYELYLEGLCEFEKQHWAEAQGKLIACREIMAVLDY
jgi:outer membrane protein assembly factor BamD (BamD/ComL family)